MPLGFDLESFFPENLHVTRFQIHWLLRNFNKMQKHLRINSLLIKESSANPHDISLSNIYVVLFLIS